MATHKPVAEALSSPSAFETPAQRRVVVRDVIALMKPRITTNVTITAALGLFLAGRMPDVEPASVTTVLSTLVGTALIVSGANALNMFIERDIDRHMPRTRKRPLPAGRMAPQLALWIGVGLSVAAFPVLAIGANPLTALLAVIANALYVLAYTPLKQRSSYALHVGAIPGAIPPLLGWSAVTERIDAAGLVLFAILFLWQIPHFVAITLFRKADYARAGLVVLPNVVGELAARHTIVRWIVAVVASSLLVVPLGLAHRGYLACAMVLGGLFFLWGCYGLRPGAGTRWAVSLFAFSIVYQLLLFIAMVVDPFAGL
jgi:protoheme IX farnesyltransferase